MKTFQRFVPRIRPFLCLEMGASRVAVVVKTLFELLGTVQIASRLTVLIAEWSAWSMFAGNSFSAAVVIMLNVLNEPDVKVQNLMTIYRNF